MFLHQCLHLLFYLQHKRVTLWGENKTPAHEVAHVPVLVQEAEAALQAAQEGLRDFEEQVADARAQIQGLAANLITMEREAAKVRSQLLFFPCHIRHCKPTLLLHSLPASAGLQRWFSNLGARKLLLFGAEQGHCGPCSS